MLSHTNGWPVIESWMKLNKITQTEIARLLSVSSSAVTQFKKGEILLKAEQLNKILDYLKFDDDAKSEFYQSIFRGRMNYEGELVYPSVLSPCENSDKMQNLPIIEVRQLSWYEPAFSSIADFAFRHHCSFRPCINISKGLWVLAERNFFESELFEPTLLLIDGARYPQNGDLVLCRAKNGQILMGYYVRRRAECTLFLLNHEKIEWTLNNINFIHWMHPIIEIVGGNFQDLPK